MTKTSILLAALPALLFACGKPASVNDDANDAAGTGGAGLAREVVGVHMLSNDTNYDSPCNYLAEEFVSGTFNLGGTTLEKFDRRNGCEFHWDGNKVSFMMQAPKPFPSIYHAEYTFDRLFQPSAAGVTSGQSAAGNPQKPSLSGPNSEGTGSEMPATNLGSAKRDTSAANDTASTVSGVTKQASQFSEPVKSEMGFVGIPGIGDKAVWEPAKHTLHVLYNQHIINVVVQTRDNEATKRARAATLANVILNQFVEQNR
ncbi:MAG: hypothetical protein EAZ91_11820 [Cytophagales bacterium]|nr:MAG: hypothetical protein EAZ91_11820 [Cytophagales bacterium]